MSEVVPCLLQTNMSEDLRSKKLHKQIEAKNDEAAGTGNLIPVNIASMSAGILTLDGQPPSDISGSAPNESQLRGTLPSPNTRNKTLLRGQALEEETSPPPELIISPKSHNGNVTNGFLLPCGPTADSPDQNGKLKGQSNEAKEYLLASHKVSSDSGHGTLDHNDDASDTSVLSRDSSVEKSSVGDLYKDSSGVNIPKFMRETLMKSVKDKKTILALEEQLLSFVNNGVQVYKMAEMTSYERMIAHRLAAFLGVEHNVDSTGKCIILNRTEITRSIKLSDVFLFEESGDHLETKKKILLKKQPASFDEKHGRGGNKAQFGSHRAKSLEERQQNYNEARERIFKDDENQCEEEVESNNFLTVNHVPQEQDSIRSTSQHPTKWIITDASGDATERHKVHSISNPASSITNYNPASNQSTHSQESIPVSTSGDLRHTTNSTLDAAPSNITQLSPHGQPDGLVYHFDTTCPPPMLVQPQVLPPTEHVVYHNDSMPDMTSRFAAASVGSLDQSNETFAMGMPGQVVPMSAFMLHPQSMYTPNYPSQIQQGQYFVSPMPVGPQQPVKYVAIPYEPSHSQQFLHGVTADRQGHTTIPMPAVGSPAVQGAGSFHVINSPGQPSMAVANPPQCVDMNSVTYHCGTLPESMLAGGAGSLNSSTTPGSSHLVLAYVQVHPQHSSLSSPAAQFIPSGSTPSGTTYYAIPVASPTPPLSLTQPPPSSISEIQHHPPPIFYTSNVGNPLTYQNPTSATSLKPLPSPFFPAHQHQQQLHSHQSAQPVVVSSNSHHPSHLALNYNHPFKPGPPVHGPQFVALHTNPYQIRPSGSTMLHLAGNPVVHTPQLVPGLQLQSYQFVRPSGSVPEVRLVNPSSIRSGLPPLQITTATNLQQIRPKSINQYRQPKKELKKLPLSAVDEGQGSQGTGILQQQGHMSLISPLNLSGSTYTHIPSYYSNRQ
jgi:hypothetical protein